MNGQEKERKDLGRMGKGSLKTITRRGIYT